MKSASHPSGKNIIFDPAQHLYLLDGEELPSVTTIIKQYFPQFDAEKVAARKAEKGKKTAQELIESWNQIREEASAFGNLIHAMAEKIVLRRDLGAADELAKTEKEKRFLEALKSAISQISKNFYFVETEKVIFSPERNIAGTIDVLLKHKKTGRIIIADWKTSKEIRKFAFKNEKGLDICQHLPNCNYIHYSLQLAIYREILLREGYFDRSTQASCAIIHLIDEEPLANFQQITPKNLDREAKAILALR